VALLEIQVLHAPHIAEADDAAMTRMEAQMAAAAGTVRKTLDELKRLTGAKASAQLTAVVAAFDHSRTRIGRSSRCRGETARFDPRRWRSAGSGR
jgi:hypothetical protein